jgi:thiamine phosphate synthase YjbQ (UPF0047 family)
MKVLTEYLTFHTRTHRAYVHITPQVEDAVKKSAVKEGLVLVSSHAHHGWSLRERQRERVDRGY